MADHLRKQIRDAAKAALTGLTTTGANVFSGRISPLKDSEKPGLVIFLNSDSGLPDATGGDWGTVLYTGSLRIEGICSEGDGTIDILDTIALEVETALFGAAGASLRALLSHTMIGPADTQIFVEDAVQGGAKRLGTIAVTYPIQYRAALGDPSTKV